jgi:hypothetical protein
MYQKLVGHGARYRQSGCKTYQALRGFHPTNLSMPSNHLSPLTAYCSLLTFAPSTLVLFPCSNELF